MNKVHLIGRTTNYIEMKMTPSKKRVCSFTLAVNRRKKEDGADFIPCVAWEATAELLSRYVQKGDRIAVSGRVQTRNYEGTDGRKVYVTEIIVEDVEFLEGKKKDEEKPVEVGDVDLPF